MRRLAIRLLGPFEVAVDGAPVTSFEYAKVRALLAYLAVEAQRPLPRAELAALLWPDQPEKSARGSLSQALTTLRNALGDKAAPSPLLLADAQSVQLDPSSAVEVDVDAVQFLALVRASATHAHRSVRTCAPCSERLQLALGLYRGHFLADVSIADSEVFEEWASLQREHLLQRALSILERLVERAQWRGAYTDALTYAQRLVALEPILEANQRTYMRLLAMNGETAAALAHYRQVHALLAQELGAEPEEATTAVFNQIRRGDTAGWQSPSPPFAVPRPPTPLVGRDREHQALCAQLRDPAVRAVTITGAGGIGKTRLSIEVAHTLRHDFEDGIFVVELAAINDVALVASTIARALGVKDRPQQRIDETLRDHLRAKQILLVLDNFEHVVAAAPLVSALLAACPALTVLLTSRAPLMIRAEQQLPLEPLDDTNAMQLFVQRAQAAGAVLHVDAESAALYAAICRRLDRLPLAIELIAVRARTLTPIELLRQLERPLQALARGPRDLAARHQSLRQVIQWSYDLLDPEEQRVFRCLGVFAGGCTVEAAQAVLGESLAALPVIESLFQNSLLQRQAVADQTRFLLLETIREFAREQLRLHGEEEDAQRRHAAHYAAFSMTAYVELLREDAARWRAWVACDQDNLRLALRWALEHQQHEIALRLATGVWRFYWMSGYLREGLDQLEAALAYREYASLEAQTNALRAAGALATGLNDYARARQWLEAAVEAAWRLGDPGAIQPTLTNLGYALLHQGELDDARIHLEVSLSLARRAEDSTVAKFPLGLLAGLHLRLGNYAEAQAMSEEGLSINQARRDTEGTADALRTLAAIVNARGDVRRAQHLGEEALALHRSLNHQSGMGLDYALLGDIARMQADYIGALAQYRQCLALWRDRENTMHSATVLGSIAQTLSSVGEPARAATLLAAVAAIRARASVRLTAAEQSHEDEALRACAKALGDDALADACAAGQALSSAQAIDLALEYLTSIDPAIQRQHAV
jgi:predicted ATPase/DNA-binding SARP family transcriptional activator